MTVIVKYKATGMQYSLTDVGALVNNDKFYIVTRKDGEERMYSKQDFTITRCE